VSRPSSGLAVSVASYLTTLAAAANLGAVVSGSSWWWGAATLGALAIGSAALVRLKRTVLGTPVAAVVAVVGVLVMFAADTLIVVLPSERTLPRIEALVQQAVAHIAAESMPAAPDRGLDLLLVTGILAVMIVIDSLAVLFRKPLIAALPLLALALIPGRAASAPAELLGATVTIVGVLAMLWLDRRRDAPGPLAPAIAVATIAVLGGGFAQSIIPALDSSSASGATLRPVFASGADPLVRLGDHLRRGREVTALTYETTSTEPVYLRVVTIDDLVGEEWSASELDQTPAGSRPLDTFPSPPGLAESVERETVTTTVEDAFTSRRWLPVPYPAVSVTDLDDQEAWQWDPENLAVGGVRSEETGEYTVTSLDLRPTAEQLRSSGAPSIDAERYLTLPQDLPTIIGETTAAVTAGAATGYDRALAIQEYLRSSEFEYDENTPEEADGDGDSFDVIATFLEDKSGYCVHYASAMTVMARAAGIPARIAVGYQPGDRQITDPGSYEVTSHDLHSWPELYFEGVGWTRFEPTPGRGDVPDYAENIAQEDQQEEQDQEAATPTPTTSAAQRENDPGATTGGDAGGGLPSLPVALLASVGVLGVLAVPALLRVALRRRRLAALREGTVSPSWDELHDTGIDLGLAEPQMSPRMLADAVTAALPAERGGSVTLAAWLRAVEAERFGRKKPAGADLDQDKIDGLLTDLRSASSRTSRFAAWVAPRSLLLAVTARIRSVSGLVGRFGPIPPD